MAPNSNLADFLVQTLNALCGGYRQEGELVPNRKLLMGGIPPVADVLPPNRSWEGEPRCRSEDAGPICGELLTPLLPQEILSPGKDKIRALIVFSGNPAVAIVDPDRTKAALRDLDLLVTLDCRASETTELSHYVIATSTFYERHELSGYTEFLFDKTFVDYSKPVVGPPPAAIHDWQFFYGIAKRIGIELEYKYMGLLMDYRLQPPGLKLDMQTEPNEEDIIAWICMQRGLSYDELAASSGGITYDLPPLVVAAAPNGGSGARLDVCPEDVAQELHEVLTSRFDDRYAYRLASRRLPQVMNSLLRDTPRLREKGKTNYAYMNPEDMNAEGLKDGDRAAISSGYAQIVATVVGDQTVRRSVVSMAHCFDGPGGAHTGRLVPLAAGYREPISFMPHQSGIPINVARLA